MNVQIVFLSFKKSNIRNRLKTEKRSEVCFFSSLMAEEMGNPTAPERKMWCTSSKNPQPFQWLQLKHAGQTLVACIYDLMMAERSQQKCSCALVKIHISYRAEAKAIKESIEIFVNFFSQSSKDTQRKH